MAKLGAERVSMLCGALVPARRRRGGCLVKLWWLLIYDVATRRLCREARRPIATLRFLRPALILPDPIYAL